MTDLEKFINLYKGFGIGLIIKEDILEEGGNLVKSIKLGGWACDERLLDGYCGFYSRVYFTECGKFISQGFWE